MEKLVMNTDLLEQIFEGRNKSYGAYDLQRQYPTSLGKALFAGLLLALAVLLYAQLSGRKVANTGKKVEYNISNDLTIPVREVKMLQPKPQKASTLPQATVKYLPYKVTTDRQVITREVLATLAELKEKDPGMATLIGNANVKQQNIALSSEPGRFADERQQAIIQPVQEDEDKLFRVVQQKPEFPGGDAALVAYLRANINYPAVARESGLQGMVFIQFIIERDGAVTSVRIVKDNVGGGAGLEAQRVVKHMPAWKAGKQNGRTVRVQYTLPVSFRLQD